VGSGSGVGAAEEQELAVVVWAGEARVRAAGSAGSTLGSRLGSLDFVDSTVDCLVSNFPEVSFAIAGLAEPISSFSFFGIGTGVGTGDGDFDFSPLVLVLVAAREELLSIVVLDRRFRFLVDG